MMQHFALKCGVYSREAFNQINAVFHKVNLVHIVLLEKLSGFECFFFLPVRVVLKRTVAGD